MKLEENRYLNYQSMVTTVTTGMARLDGICQKINMEPQAETLKNSGNRLKEHTFSVGIMGEFRRGKSTVINALLGQSIVPSDIVPCSATLNYIKWDTNKRAEINFKDGTSKEVPVDELSNYVTKITKESQAMAETVENAVVYYPCTFCQNGVQIIDTPGLNDDERMTAISENVIPALDAIIMVLVPDSPFSQSEAEFVRNKVMASDLGKLIFVVNKIDIVDEDDRPRLLESIKDKIQTSVLEKMALVYGKDSDEFNNAKAKLGDIKIIPVSAKRALKGKLNGNNEILEDSGYLEFENVLSKMLTEERGVLELLQPVNQVLSTAKMALENIETRKEALNVDANEFETIQKESIEKIKATRAKKKDELEILKLKGKNLYSELLPEVNDTYNELESELTCYISEYPISEFDLQTEESSKALIEQISDGINKKIEDSLAIGMERLNYKIKEQVGKDAGEFTKLAVETDEIIYAIRNEISSKSCYVSDNKGMTAGVIADAGVLLASATFFDGLIPGVGGIISGYKEHGLKGAVVGGVSGAGIGLATGLLLAPLGIVGLPFALIMGVASTFGGKAITRLIFGKKNKQEGQIEATREKILESIPGIINNLRTEKFIENWLSETCEDTYNSIADEIDKELESNIRGLEDTITQITVDIETNAANKEILIRNLDDYAEEIKVLLEDISPVQKKLTEGLNA